MKPQPRNSSRGTPAECVTSTTLHPNIWFSSMKSAAQVLLARIPPT